MKLTIKSVSHSRDQGFFLIEGDKAEQTMDKMIELNDSITWDCMDDEGATAVYNKGFTTTEEIRELYKECK